MQQIKYVFYQEMLKSISNFLFKSQSNENKSKQKQIQKVLIEMSSKCHNCKVIRWKDGTVFVGDSCGEIMSGLGKLIFPNGQFYEGSFKNNHFNGKGKYYSHDGIYQGEWKNGLKDGFAKQKNLDGSQFIGKYQKGLKEGIGFFQWADGSFYQGMFKQDKMEGPGKMSYGNGVQIIGQWKENEIFGIARQTDGEGNIYIGNFYLGNRHGKGQLIQKNKTIEGYWQQGNLIGPAIVLQNDGVCMNIKTQDKNYTLIQDNQYQKLRTCEITQQ